MQEPGGADTPIRAVAGVYGLLHNAVFGVGVADIAPVSIPIFRNEVGDTIGKQGIRFLFSVAVITQGASSRSIRNLHYVPEVVIGELAC